MKDLYRISTKAFRKDPLRVRYRSEGVKRIPRWSIPRMWAQSYIVIASPGLSISQEAAHSTAPIDHEGVLRCE